jgi:hypothetical protein
MASYNWCNSSSLSGGITTINICKSSKSSSYPTSLDHNHYSSSIKTYGEVTHNPSPHAHNTYKAENKYDLYI